MGLPLPTDVWIADKFGKGYRVTFKKDPPFLLWEVWSSENVNLGYARCRPSEDVILLEDLRIEDDVPGASQQGKSLFQWLTGRGPQKPTYRKRGIGTALLGHILRESAALGFKRMKGVIKARDYNVFPGLPGWYIRNGFHVTLRTDRSFAVADLDYALERLG
jgi:GNAT superfamily N-acetyltransferase